MDTAGDVFEKFVQIIKKLRDPNGGCPWDLEQTHQTLRPYIVEETYEVLEAIEAEDDAELCGELGDVLLQVVLHAQLAADREAFSIADVVKQVTDKMIRRHPHVFGTTTVEGTKDVLRNWETIKFNERKSKDQEDSSSMLAGVPKSMPALLRAQRLGEKAAKVSFDWKSPFGVWEKVKEELGELKAEIGDGSDLKSPERRKALEHELGDLLFSLCQLARWLGISAEDSLRGCGERFVDRFHQMEKNVARPLSELNEDQLEAEWQKAKKMLGR